MDGAKADHDGEVLGLGGYCHALFFALPLAASTRRANSIATLEFMALIASAATFHAFFPFSSQTRSLLPSTSRTRKQRTRRPSSVRLSTFTPCLPPCRKSRLHVRH
eukprot:5634597-Pleurochrysis_carterae.AAC.1